MLTISIITAVYNNKDNIRNCIESVASQKYPHIEHIVVDGKSTDGTVDIIRSCESSIRQWISEKDNGIYDALNKGISLATGDVIGFLHSDDLFENPTIVKKIADVFHHTQCDAVYGNLVYVSKTDTQSIVRYWQSNPFDVKRFRQGWMPPHPTLFMKKKVYAEFGTFNLKYHIASDYDLMLRTVGSGKLVCEYLPEIITRMRVGGASNKSLKNIWRKSYEDWRALKENKKGGLRTLFLKNISKLGQFFRKG